jgi:hypothetical protein
LTRNCLGILLVSFISAYFEISIGLIIKPTLFSVLGDISGKKARLRGDYYSQKECLYVA